MTKSEFIQKLEQELRYTKALLAQVETSGTTSIHAAVLGTRGATLEEVLMLAMSLDEPHDSYATDDILEPLIRYFKD